MTTATIIEEPTEILQDAEASESQETVTTATADKRKTLRQVVSRAAYALFLAVPFLLAIALGYLKYVDWQQHQSAIARTESVRAASDTAVAMLSYRPDTVQSDLDAAKNRMTGVFRDSYSSLVNDVVAPAAIQKLITVSATVPAATSVSTTANHAVVLLFIDQTATVGKEPPSTTKSCVRVTLDKNGGRWLVSGFDPV